jgi:hypothetical protein
MEGIRERYLELFEAMAKSANPENMKIFGEAEKWAFDRLYERDPKLAEMWVDKLEAMLWNNYLSRAEANEIVDKFINQDGTHGAHWSYDVFKGAAEALGVPMMEAPFFNCYALWAVANMIYSDHAQSIAEDMGYKSPKEVSNEKMATSIYKKSIEKLKDADRPKFVRRYFDV